MDVEINSVPLESLEKAAEEVVDDVEEARRAEEIIKEAEREQKIREEKMELERDLLVTGASSSVQREEGYHDNAGFEPEDDIAGLKRRRLQSSDSSGSLNTPPPYQRHDVSEHGGATTSAAEKIEPDVVQEVQEGSLMKSVLCAFVICIGSFNFGLVIGYPSPAMPDLNAHRNPFHLDDDQVSWIGSIVTLAALFGSLVAGMYMDLVGRKAGLLFLTLPMQIGWIIILASPNFGCLMAGRAVTGVCMGLLSVLCPVYISEVSPPSIRGLLGSSHQLFICLAILFTYAFGTFLSWTWLAISCMAWALILSLILPFIPESPRWLLQKGRKEEAREGLVWIRGKKANVDVELLEIEKGIQESQDQASLKEFLEPQLWKPLAISVGLMILQQFSGINVIMFYTVQIFQQAKVDLDPNVQSIIVGAVGVLGTLVSVAISDKAGRRVLLVLSGIIMSISMAGMGAFFYEQEYGNVDNLSWLPIVCLVFFNFGFDMAFGPIPWLMMSELFPQRAKGIATSVSSAVNWLFAFIMTKTWVNMTAAMGIYGAYWFCCGFCALSVPFIIFIVPETKGRTLEEIERFFK